MGNSSYWARSLSRRRRAASSRGRRRTWRRSARTLTSRVGPTAYSEPPCTCTRTGWTKCRLDGADGKDAASCARRTTMSMPEIPGAMTSTLSYRRRAAGLSGHPPSRRAPRRPPRWQAPRDEAPNVATINTTQGPSLQMLAVVGAPAPRHPSGEQPEVAAVSSRALSTRSTAAKERGCPARHAVRYVRDRARSAHVLPREIGRVGTIRQGIEHRFESHGPGRACEAPR